MVWVLHLKVESKNTSGEIMAQFEPEMFDWIYVDGNHYYEYVLEDLRLSYDKLKTSGLLAGDDYNWGKELGYPVKQAVTDFLYEGDKGELRVYGSQFVIQKLG